MGMERAGPAVISVRRFRRVRGAGSLSGPHGLGPRGAVPFDTGLSLCFGAEAKSILKRRTKIIEHTMEFALSGPASRWLRSSEKN